MVRKNVSKLLAVLGVLAALAVSSGADFVDSGLSLVGTTVAHGHHK